MKIKFLNDLPLSLSYGGKEQQMSDYFNSLKKNGHDISMFDVNNLNEFDDLDVLHLFGEGGLISDIIKFIKINNIKVKIIVSPSFYRRPYYFYQVLKVLEKFKIPTWYRYKKNIYEDSDSIIVNSEIEKEYLLKIFNINKNNIKVIYNKVDLNITNKKHLKDFEFKNFFLFVIHLNERKNILNLLAAQKLIFEKHNIKLILVGKNRFDKISNHQKFLKIIKNNSSVKYIPGLDKNINEDYNKLQYLFRNCMFHILPSHVESPGISSLEAISFSKKILVGDFSIVKEYFKDEASYCKFGIHEIYNAINLMLNENHFNDKKYSSELLNKISLKNLLFDLNRVYSE